MDNVGGGVSTATQVADQLRELIVTGELGGGTALREVALSESFSVSRNTLREGVRILAAEGLVDQQLHTGATVTRIGTERIRDIYMVRRVTEVRAVELSVYASDAQLRRLRDIVERGTQAGRRAAWSAYSRASMDFHQALVALVGSPMLDEFFRRVMLQARLIVSWADPTDASRRQWLELDQRICDLVIAGQRAEAATELEQYLDGAERWALDTARRRGV